MFELRWIIRQVHTIENNIFALREVKVLQYRPAPTPGTIEPWPAKWTDVPTVPEGSDG